MNTRLSTLPYILFCIAGLLILAFFSNPPIVTAQDDFEPDPIKPIYWTGTPPQVVGEQMPPESVPYNEVPAGTLDPMTGYIFNMTANGRDRIYKVMSGYQVIQLPDVSDHDIQPDANPGMTRIAFSANPEGQYDIYSMDINGQDVQRLTNTPGDDVNPAWSPDGKRIAFESYRDGQGEVYTMNANGNGQSRLTNHAAYDGMPDWSPDSQQIVFVSKRSGGFRVWAVNVNGSDLRQINNQGYSAYPKWSPDGTLIAFAADDEGDGDQDLWKINVDGSELYRIHVYNSSDLIPGSFSPSGEYIGITQIYWAFNNVDWYIVYTELIASDISGTFNYIDNIGYGNYPMNIDWESLDNIAPQSKVTTLPGESGAPITVRWSGSDTGGRGVLSYDIQVRDGASGTWTTWLSHVTTTSAAYPGIGGHTYSFRSRARDKHFNLETYPSTADTWTRVESQPPSSRVRAMPQYTRSEWFNVLWSGRDYGGSTIGNYDIFYKILPSGEWEEWITGTQLTSVILEGLYGEGYAFMSRAIDTSQNQEALPSVPDAQTTSYRWMSSGVVEDIAGIPLSDPDPLIIPPPFSMATHVNQYTAYAGGDSDTYTIDWTRPGYGNLPTSTFPYQFDAENQVVVIPPLENLVVNGGFEDGNLGYWSAEGSINPQVMPEVRHSGEYGLMLGREALLELHQDYFPATVVRYLDFVVTPDGVLDVVYSIDTRLYFTRRLLTGDWTAPQLITQLSSPFSEVAFIGEKNLWLIEDGSLFFVFSGFDPWSTTQPVHLAIRQPNGSWSVESNVLGKNFYKINVLMNSDKTVHVFWMDGTNNSDIIYRQRTPAGDWLPTEKIYSTFDIQFNKDAVIDPAGDIHFFYFKNNLLLSYTRSDDGIWHSQQVKGNYPESGLTDFSAEYTPDGMLHLAHQCLEYGTTCYTRRTPQGEWIPSQIIPQNPYPEILLDRQNRIHMFGSLSTYLRVLDNDQWSGSYPLVLGFSPHLRSFSAFGSDNLMLVGIDNYYTLVYQRILHGIPESTSHSIICPACSSDNVIRSDDKGNIHMLAGGSSGSQQRYYTSTMPDTDATSKISQQVAIPADMPTPYLSFVYQLFNADEVLGSGLTVTVTDGADTQELFGIQQDAEDYTHIYADLSAYKGKTVTLSFRVDEKAGGQPVNAWLDEITIGSAYPEIWPGFYGPAGVQPGQEVAYSLTVGNQGAGDPGVMALSLSLPDGLTFVSADPAPDVTGDTLVWNHLAVGPEGEMPVISLVVSVDAGIPLMSLLTGTIEVAAGVAEAETANNLLTYTLWVGDRLFLPLINR